MLKTDYSLEPGYRFDGSELYVRAKVTSLRGRDGLDPAGVPPAVTAFLYAGLSLLCAAVNDMIFKAYAGRAAVGGGLIWRWWGCCGRASSS